MKRIKVLLMCLMLVSMCFTGCEANSNSNVKEEITSKEENAVENIGKEDLAVNVVVEGSIFGGSKDTSVAATVKYNPDWLTVNDNTVYNSELAKFCSIVCADTYFRTKDLEKNTQNRVLYEGENADEYTNGAFLTKLGFSDIQFIETYKAGEYTVDTNDSATILMGYNNVDDKYDVFVIAIRGCFSIGEWTSIFDLGGSTSEYSQITGEHTEWSNKAEHKGVSIAAVRARHFIDEYIKSHAGADRKTCVLTTGHSRGGAIANIIGAEYEKDDKIHSYTYTFNACAATNDNKAKEYKTIFNISDSNDIFENVTPFKTEKLIRYGKDLQIAILSSEDAKKAVADVKGRDDFASLSTDKKSEYIKLFGERFTDRNSLYDMHCLVTKFDSKEDADNYLTECQTIIGAEEGLGIELYCNLKEVALNDDGKYEVTLEYCDEALLSSYSKIFVYGDAAYQGVAKLFMGDTEGCKVAAFINDNLADINAGHHLVNGYAILDLLK